MKQRNLLLKLFIFIFIVLFLFACNNTNNDNTPQSIVPIPEESPEASGCRVLSSSSIHNNNFDNIGEL